MHKIRAGLLTLFLLVLLPLVAARAELLRVDTNTSLRGVYLIEDPTADMVRVSAIMLAGEADARGPEGIAHYLEHLMFWHADRVRNRIFHSRGGNAWVNGIITNYYNEGRQDEMPDLFAFAARLLTPPALDPAFMRRERDIVLREYELRVSENPKWKSREQMLKALYGGNPLGRSLIGNPTSIGQLTLEAVEQFRANHYTAANMVLVASGNLSAPELKHQAEQAFGGAPLGPVNRQNWRNQPASGDLQDTLAVVDKLAKTPTYLFGALTPWQGTGDALQDLYVLRFVNDLLTSSLDGGLARPLTDDAFIVSTFRVEIGKRLRDQVQFFFQGQPDLDVTPETVGEELKSSLLRLAKRGVPQKSLERIRKRLRQEAERRAREPDYILARIFRNLTAGVEPNTSADHLERIARVSKSDLDGLISAIAERQRHVEVSLSNTGS